MSEIFTGLILETSEQLARRLAEQIALPVCTGSEVKETLWSEPPSVIRIENQQQTNMCAAHAGTSVIEVVSFQVTRQMIQRSRNFLYAQAQKKCGLYGDQGVTLGAIVSALKQDGCCPEDLYPFAGRFDSQIPRGAADEAAKCKVIQTIDVHTGGYGSVRAVIGQNMGAVLMATYWPIQYSNGYIVEHYRPTGGGGHARAWLCLSNKLDSQGRPYVWCANSHSTMAQHDGWELWSPDAIDEQLRNDPWGTTGVTGMTTPGPQEVDWTGAMNPFVK